MCNHVHLLGRPRPWVPHPRGLTQGTAHAISACLLDRGLSYSNYGQVIGAFNREFLKPGILPKNYAKEIQTLFDDRQSPDYDILSPIDEATARAEIAMAEGILEGVVGYPERVKYVERERCSTQPPAR